MGLSYLFPAFLVFIYLSCFSFPFSSFCLGIILVYSLSHGFASIVGGVTQQSCPYKCMSEKYRMPNCYTPLEDLIYTFGGPWPFALSLSCILVLLALLLSSLRIKYVGSDSSYLTANSIDRQSHHHLPSLLSLSEVHWPLQTFLCYNFYVCSGVVHFFVLFFVRSCKCVVLTHMVSIITLIGTGDQSWRNSKSCSQNVLHGSQYFPGTLASSLLSSQCNYWDRVRNYLITHRLWTFASFGAPNKTEAQVIHICNCSCYWLRENSILKTTNRREPFSHSIKTNFC